MHHAAALLSSLASLGLVCAIYACNILSRPGSPWRSEILAMILLALLTGIFPLAATASLVGLWDVLTGGSPSPPSWRRAPISPPWPPVWPRSGCSGLSCGRPTARRCREGPPSPTPAPRSIAIARPGKAGRHERRSWPEGSGLEASTGIEPVCTDLQSAA